MEKKTILFIMSRLPFPSTSGRKSSLYHYCKILSENLNCKVIVASFLEKGDNPEKKPDFIDELVILPKISLKDKLFGIVCNSLLKRKVPIQVSLYWSLEAKKIIDDLEQKYKPDFVIADMVRCTEYIKDMNTFRIADLDDRLSLRYKRQLESDLDSINPYGVFINNIPKFMRFFLLNNFVKKIVLKNEIALLQKYEIEIGKQCDLTVFVAKKEVENFNKELGQEKAVVVPIGVDTDYFYPDFDLEKDDYIGFLGLLSVAHNENAIKYFVNNIFPKVLEKKPKTKFLIIGGGASDELKKLESDNIIFTGRVDDVRNSLSKCKVFVCPLQFGSGIKTKNLEAMAMGLPIVTTSIGAENIDADSDCWFVCDKIEEFSNKILLLLNDDELRKKIGKNASIFIRNNWTWDTARKAFSKIIE